MPQYRQPFCNLGEVNQVGGEDFDQAFQKYLMGFYSYNTSMILELVLREL